MADTEYMKQAMRRTRMANRRHKWDSAVRWNRFAIDERDGMAMPWTEVDRLPDDFHEKQFSSAAEHYRGHRSAKGKNKAATKSTAPSVLARRSRMMQASCQLLDFKVC
eukprot:TRINITY_DN37687_c0_g1_i1.p2 TRINITY_DN37687_c0_g1~~TRINITY_DN37687_c0_g1_i1.p2  ORF type:complete len:108 (+),score=29.03 TRINITY_DN37687_c0_g1_i1:44-367(+)